MFHYSEIFRTFAPWKIVKNIEQYSFTKIILTTFIKNNEQKSKTKFFGHLELLKRCQ